MDSVTGKITAVLEGSNFRDQQGALRRPAREDKGRAEGGKGMQVPIVSSHTDLGPRHRYQLPAGESGVMPDRGSVRWAGEES